MDILQSVDYVVRDYVMKTIVVQFVEAQFNQPSEPIFQSDSKVSKVVTYIEHRTACVVFFIVNSLYDIYVFKFVANNHSTL